MAESCDVVFSCLPDFGAIDSVALGPDGVLAGARAGAAFFAMSTNTLDLVRRRKPPVRAALR
jgi:3-hydroxyisobutyrate dehydrogenase-like beta-hydroxyacid dehydrogenase